MKFDIKIAKQKMKDMGINQIELSKRSGVPLQTIRYIFSNRTQNPRIDTVEKIYEVLGLKAIKEAESPSNILFDKISILSDEEVAKAKDYLDFIISQRK